MVLMIGTCDSPSVHKHWCYMEIKQTDKYTERLHKVSRTTIEVSYSQLMVQILCLQNRIII